MCLVASDPVTPWTVACPWNSPGKNPGGACHALLQGIFPTQGSKPGLRHCRQILYHLGHQGNPNRMKFRAINQMEIPNSHFLSQITCTQLTWGLPKRKMKKKQTKNRENLKKQTRILFFPTSQRILSLEKHFLHHWREELAITSFYCRLIQFMQ